MGILSELDVTSSLPFVCIAIALVNQALQGFWCRAQAREEQVPEAAASVTFRKGVTPCLPFRQFA